MPSGQAHLNDPSILVQSAERPQGLLVHSSTSKHPSSGFPSYPSGHLQVKVPGKFTQSAPGPHTPSVWHSSISSHCKLFSIFMEKIEIFSKAIFSSTSIFFYFYGKNMKYFERQFFEISSLTYSHERVSLISLLARARVTSLGILTKSILTAGTWFFALVYILAMLFAVALKTGQTFAQKIGRQIATLCILHATGSDYRILALVNVWKFECLYIFQAILPHPSHPRAIVFIF